MTRNVFWPGDGLLLCAIHAPRWRRVYIVVTWLVVLLTPWLGALILISWGLSVVSCLLPMIPNTPLLPSLLMAWCLAYVLVCLMSRLMNFVSLGAVLDAMTIALWLGCRTLSLLVDTSDVNDMIRFTSLGTPRQWVICVPRCYFDFAGPTLTAAIALVRIVVYVLNRLAFVDLRILGVRNCTAA